jgi:uncharacterized protein (TIGR01777 family)
MKIALTGSHGLVGSALLPRLQAAGFEVLRLIHARPGQSAGLDEIPWNINAGTLDAIRLESAQAVIHLAGENIAGRWTAEKKRRIRDSRVKGTQLLCDTLAKLDNPPQTLICASATGFYGSRGDELLDENSAPGSGFLPDVCREWEGAARGAQQAGIRVVFLRSGIVLAAHGGALKKMLTPFKLGLGGVLGGGKQYWSWITLDDEIGAIMHVLQTPAVFGPVNLVSPKPATNREFTKTLGKVLARPTIFPVPKFAVKMAFGEMGEALLLASARVLPQRLKASGYKFHHPELEGALRHVLGR